VVFWVVQAGSGEEEDRECDLFFLGPPGVGKGTQAENISTQKNIHHISSGDLLRETVKKRTKIGVKVK